MPSGLPERGSNPRAAGSGYDCNDLTRCDSELIPLAFVIMEDVSQYVRCVHTRQKGPEKLGCATRKEMELERHMSKSLVQVLIRWRSRGQHVYRCWVMCRL